MKKVSIFFLSVLLIAFPSCKECPCVPGSLRFDLIGFSDTEADTFIIKKFEANGNFNIKTDSFFIDHVRYRRSNDTLKLVAYPGTAVLEGRSDYEIFFPASNSLFRITEISEQKSTQNCGLFSTTKVACVNPIRSFKMNGTLMNPYPFNDFYLRK